MTTETNGAKAPPFDGDQPASSPENAQVIALTRKDFVSDQEVRWCPGCGDYSSPAQTQKVMPDFGYKKEDIVISGIGCSGRLPYYMNTFGFHDAWPCPDAGDRPQGRAPRPHGLGHHGRWRRAVDRWQPPDALDAAERGRAVTGHVQQPDTPG